MSRLPHITPTHTTKIAGILEHLDDTYPEDAARLREYLTSGSDQYGHEDIADILTRYCRENNLGPGVSESSVRRYRKAIA